MFKKSSRIYLAHNGLAFIVAVLLCSVVDAFSIVTIDKNSPSKHEAIHELLLLQKSLIVNFKEPIPDKNAKTGFLLVPMAPEFVAHLLEEKDGVIVSAYEDKTLVGYIILTDTTEFKELYYDETKGHFETSIDAQALEAWLAKSTVGYIEQIAVKPGYSRTGIGTELIATSKKLKPYGLIADVFIYPIKNEPSLHFFTDQGFTKPGILYQTTKSNVNFPYAHRTQVFFWKFINR